MRKTVELGRRGCPGAPEGQNHGEGVLEGRPGLLGKQEAGRSQRKLSTWQGSPGTLPDSGERWEPNDDGVKEGRRLSTSEQSRVSSYYHPRDLQGLGSRGRGGLLLLGGRGRGLPLSPSRGGGALQPPAPRPRCIPLPLPSQGQGRDAEKPIEADSAERGHLGAPRVKFR